MVWYEYLCILIQYLSGYFSLDQSGKLTTTSHHHLGSEYMSKNYMFLKRKRAKLILSATFEKWFMVSFYSCRLWTMTGWSTVGRSPAWKLFKVVPKRKTDWMIVSEMETQTERRNVLFSTISSWVQLISRALFKKILHLKRICFVFDYTWEINKLLFFFFTIICFLIWLVLLF